jgi:SnoaL-like domain
MKSAIQRREFICKAGAALSATVAAAGATTALAANEAPPPNSESEIRQLHHNFVERLNGRRYTELRELFASDDDNDNDSTSISDHALRNARPLVEHFDRSLPEGLRHPVHDYFTGHTQHLDTIEVAPDHQRASARFHCLTRMESALGSTIPLVEMACQQGQGAIQWWEPGVLENSYVKVASGWKISRLSFRPTGPWRWQP